MIRYAKNLGVSIIAIDTRYVSTHRELLKALLERSEEFYGGWTALYDYYRSKASGAALSRS